MNVNEVLKRVDYSPEVYWFRTNRNFLQRLWSGGDLGSGSLVITTMQLVFLKSGIRQRLAGTGPLPQSVDDLHRLSEVQLGIRIPLSEIASHWVSAEGVGRYGYGRSAFSELSILQKDSSNPQRFRFGRSETADEVNRLISELEDPASTTSSVEPDLSELDIPHDYLLSASLDRGMMAAWCRSTIAFANRCLKSGKYQATIKLSTQLLEDVRLKDNAEYALVLSAANFLRGAAYLAQGNLVAARMEFEGSVQRVPSYRLAASVLSGLPISNDVPPPFTPGLGI
jgi:hypothetical protein